MYMPKKTLVQQQNDSNIQFTNSENSTFIQSRNKLISTAKKHVMKYGMSNNIIGVLSQNNYINDSTPKKHNRFIRENNNSIVKINNFVYKNLQNGYSVKNMIVKNQPRLLSNMSLKHNNSSNNNSSNNNSSNNNSSNNNSSNNISSNNNKTTTSAQPSHSNNLKIPCSDNKILHRHNCYSRLRLIKNITIPNINNNSINETVLVEFRQLFHLEFLLRNMLINFPRWSHTVVCGNLNYSFMQNLCNAISDKIKVIKLDVNNLTPSDYSRLLMSKQFWLNFTGEKILLYQEDTMLFHNNIDEFLKYDYIGASWPTDQDDNSYGVGNGGFSLRTKAKMIECIEKINPATNLKLGKSTINYMKNTKSYHIPEDVYFSKSLIDHKLGSVARRDVANRFSQETQLCNNPLGGHCFWLANGNKIDIGISYNKIAIYSPYEYSIGGGESYISAIISFFIKNGTKEVFFFNKTDDAVFYKTLEYYFTAQERSLIVKKPYRDIIMYRNKFDFFIHMSNDKESEFNFRLATKQIYHCQFPFDFDKRWNSNVNLKNNYDMIIVNSDFTFNYYKNCSKYIFNPYKIRILYPCCVNNTDVNNVNNVNKNILTKKSEKIIFVTIGRIFENEKMANNKYHDKIINVFNRISKDYTNFELHIIGSVKSERWLQYLNSIKGSNIFIHPNLKNEEKNKILARTNYIIHATGMDENESAVPFVFEHFGISVIEGLSYNCIPICTNGGFPRFYIKNGENGYLFKSGDELYNIILSILNKTATLDVNKAIDINKGVVDRFTYNNYCSTLASIILSI